MLCDVYPIRHGGQKRDPEKIRLSPHRGELIYSTRLYDIRPRWRVMYAQLLSTSGSGSYVLPVLDQARLVRIRDTGLLIAGTEIIPTSQGIKNVKSDDFPQTWWCVPVVPK